MKVLLTGGTGLVGCDLLNKLRAEDCEVYAISRKSTKLDRNHSFQIDFAKDGPASLNKIPKVDCMIHAAAAIPKVVGLDAIELYRKVNMEWSEILFQWCVQQKVQTIIYISTLNFLSRPLQKIITEDHPVSPQNFYALSKYWAEMCLMEVSKKYQLRAVSLRIPTPIPTDASLLQDTVVKRWLIESSQQKTITGWGAGKHIQNFVSTCDVADAVTKAMRNSRATGIYNIASSHSVSMLDLAEFLGNIFNAKISFKGKDPFEEDAWNVSIEKAKSDFGYSPQFTSLKAVELLVKNFTAVKK